MAQRRKVFQRKPDRVEHGDLLVALPAGHRAGQYTPQLDHREVGLELLDVALQARLRLEFDEHPRAAQHIGMQFGLAGAVAADAVEVHAGLDHLRRQDRGM